jgi:predicted signal transduction protein with EAL and GGDEF domain/CheY-like chemotaxis protein
VLVVDDDAATRALAADALTSAGFHVGEMADAKEALRRFAALGPDAVLLDVQMPGMDGFDACAQLRKLPGGQDVPVVMMTSFDDAASIHRAYQLGATDFVCKPINYSLLSHRLRYLLRAARAFRVARRGADYDALTRLPNRAYLGRYLEQALAEAKRYGHSLGVKTLDLDSFKMINDSLGHAAGDAVLQQAGDRLEACMRSSDTASRTSARALMDPRGVPLSIAARFGGDEFVVVLKRLRTPHDASIVARRVLEGLSAPYNHEGIEMFISASIGIATYPENGDNTDVLLQRADAALAHAKKSGKSCFQFFTPEIHDKATRRLAIEHALRYAITTDSGGADARLRPRRPFAEFELHFQPKVDVPARQVVGVEALLRWTTPGLGFVSPAEFIPIAEETGLIIPLGEWVLWEACRRGQEWQASLGHPLRVAVNISPRQFREADFEETVQRILQQTGFSPNALEIELTEGVMIQNDDTIDGIVSRLQEVGVRFALDDFGTGYSSLNYLTRLPIDLLKVDRSFVRALGTARNDSITLAVLALARTLDIDVVAEGVETESQLEFFEQHGPVEIQGYYFARPMPAKELPKWCREFAQRQRDAAGQRPSRAPHAPVRAPARASVRESLPPAE